MKNIHGGIQKTTTTYTEIIRRVYQDIPESIRTSRTLSIIDLDRLQQSVDMWHRCMPFVEPWYAVKCFCDDRIIQVMARDYQFGFDCASRKEIQTVLENGVRQDRIVYAHPCKRPEDLAFACQAGISLMTVDNVSEVDKISRMAAPGTRLLIRIKVPGSEHASSTGHLIPMSMKYGATLQEVPDLVHRIRSTALQVVGVSFHVGSGCTNPQAFSEIIKEARKAFELGRQAGFDMTLLDIGGGFSTADPTLFSEMTREIGRSLEEHGFLEDGTRIIAEPGRFFAESLVTLVTPIIGKCTRDSRVHYYISDGIYGSFNCLLYEHKELVPFVDQSLPVSDSVVWGPTCDSTDCVLEHVSLPSLEIGDYLIFENAGAYTLSGACDFNGIEFTRPVRAYVRGQTILDIVQV